MPFQNPLYWVTRFNPGSGGYNSNNSSPVIQERRNLRGQYVQTFIGVVYETPDTMHLVDEIHVFHFFHERRYVLDELYWYAARGLRFWLPNIPIGMVTFVRDSPIKATPVGGEEFFSIELVPQYSPLDKYNGEIKVVATRNW